MEAAKLLRQGGRAGARGARVRDGRGLGVLRRDAPGHPRGARARRDGSAQAARGGPEGAARPHHPRPPRARRERPRACHARVRAGPPARPRGRRREARTQASARLSAATRAGGAPALRRRITQSQRRSRAGAPPAQASELRAASPAWLRRAAGRCP